MIFDRFILITLWTCFCCIMPILAPNPEPVLSEHEAKLSEEHLLSESVRLFRYVQMLKDIDIEESMESIVELMNMLRLIFPVKFAKIEQKIFDMYDPSTDRTFGIAFKALMNMMRNRETRDRIHSIFQDLTVPESLVDQKTADRKESALKQPDVKVDLPLKFKSDSKITSMLSKSTAAKASASSNAKTVAAATSNKSVNLQKTNSFLPVTTEDDEKVPTSKEIKIDEIKAVPIENSPQLSQAQALKRKLSNNSTPIASDKSVEVEKRKNAERRAARLKNLLDRVKKNESANPAFQARAARLSEILSNPGSSYVINNDGKIKIQREF